MTTMITTSYLMCSMTTSSRTFYLMCSMNTSSSTSFFPSLMSSMSCKWKKPREMRQKKKKKIGGGRCPPGKCTVFGGGKYPNLRVAKVRIFGVVDILLANETQSLSHVYGKIWPHFQTQNKNLLSRQGFFFNWICLEMVALAGRNSFFTFVLKIGRNR